MLTLKDYSVFSNDNNKQLVNKVSMQARNGEIHLILGPNGAGKSSLIQSLLNLSQYKTEGTVTINDKDSSKLEIDEIARLGVFLAFQNPVEIPGLKNVEYLRNAYNRIQKEEDKLDPWSFADILESYTKILDLPEDTPQRGLNEGFSGGEKKKFELLQLLLLEPKLVLLDEIDSGLDIDAQKEIFEHINKYIKKKSPTVIIISHNKTLLENIKPTHVHLMQDGELIKSGDSSLAKEIIEKGYASSNH